MAEVTIEDRTAVNRAAKAQALLSDPEFVEAFTVVRTNLLNRFEACPIQDRDQAHEIKLMLKLLQAVRENIFSVVNTGKVIEYRISTLERAKKGIANAFRR
jgi:hypothetical protein